MIKDDKKVQHFISANILIIQRDEGRIKASFLVTCRVCSNRFVFIVSAGVEYTQETALRNRSY